MRGNRIGELGVVLDLGDNAEHFGRNLLVQLDVALELSDGRPRQGLDIPILILILTFALILAVFLIDPFDLGFKVGLSFRIAQNVRPHRAFNEHLYGAVGQLKKLENGCERAEGVNGVARGFIIASALLGHKQNLLIRAHDFFESVD